jgi:hypothetical protein
MNGREMLRRLFAKKMSMGELSELSGLPLWRLHEIMHSDKSASPEDTALLERAFSAEHRVIHGPWQQSVPANDH